MNRLYIFAIGGSGERVMYSFLMSLAAGIHIDANEVIPVFVENDKESPALRDCLSLIDCYRGVDGRMGVHQSYQEAFMDIQEYPSFCRTKIGQPVLLNISGAQVNDLDTIIRCSSHSKETLVRDAETEKSLLFTNDDLKMKLNAGFVGNPNIGSVVLNAICFNLPEFSTNILGQTRKDDGVFVIGSLYGGTGAAGFPLIVNKFKSQGNAEAKPIIGGLAILPYFNTQKEGADKNENFKYDVYPDTFGVKTRAALMYYDKYMHPDYLYYAGDDFPSTYKHSIGGSTQNNPANLIELIGAMCIKDFASQKETGETIYKRPIWGFTNDECTTSNVSCIPDADLKKAMVKFQFMKIFFENDNFIKFGINQSHEYVKNIGFTEDLRKQLIQGDNGFHKSLHLLFRDWDKWLGQLADSSLSSRHFILFNDNGEVTRQNITSKFVSDRGEFGIAKTKTRKPLFRSEIVNPDDPRICDEMINAYHILYPKGSATDAVKIKEKERLPILLRIISCALDNIIDNHCNI